MEMIRPPRLLPGARIALVSPAGPSTADRIEAAAERCRHLGLEPLIAPSAGARTGYLAGSDEARLADLQSALDDPGIAGVWAIRGGYGLMRILPHVRFDALRAGPKPFIGFSDNTAMHLALYREGIVSFHGPHAGGDFPELAERCFRAVVMDGDVPDLPPSRVDPRPHALIDGTAEGRLIGGNLALLAGLCGTPWALDARGAVLIVEDVGEPLYRIDRMLAQLKLSGVMDGVRGIGFGRFTELPDPADEAALEALLLEWTASFDVPVVAGLPVGHVAENWTLPFGVRARLDAGAGTLTLLEPAVQ